MNLSLAVPPNRRPLYALYTANLISLMGNNLTILAIPWFVLATTGSAAKTGITGFFAILPIVISGVFGGAIVDRLGYKRSSVISDIASGLTVASIALLHAADMLAFPLLLALVFLGALLDGPGNTARYALLPELVDDAKITMEQAGATIQVIERGSRLLIAPLGGFLIAVFSPVAVLWLDAASFAISALIVSSAIPANLRPASVDEEEPGGYVESLKTGFRFIRNDPLMKAIVFTVMITNGLDVARSLVGLPFLAKEVYDSSLALGLMFAASGGGSVVGAIVYARKFTGHSRRTVFIFAFMAAIVPTIGYAFLPPLWVALILQFLLGFFAGPLNPILTAVEFERIPPAMRGRVTGAITACAGLAMPAGVLLGGFLIEAIGLQLSFLLFGLISLAVTASMLINPAFRLMDKPKGS